MEGSTDEGVDAIHLLRVSLYDRHVASSTIEVEVTATTTAKAIHDQITKKLRIPINEGNYFKIVLVHTVLQESGSQNFHFLRTVRDDETVLSILAAVTEKHKKKIRHLTSSYNSSSRWIFKDTRKTPVDFGDAGELSGDSSSEDEESELSLDDLVYLRQAERRGHLYKRSTSDPNLWRRRYCVLTDKIWCINTKRITPRAISVPLNSSILLQDMVPSYDYPYCIIIYSAKSQYYFRAQSASEQQSWIAEIFHRTALYAENDVINMAEVIICDEESTLTKRRQRISSKLLSSDLVKQALSREEDRQLLVDSDDEDFVPLLAARSLLRAEMGFGHLDVDREGNKSPTINSKNSSPAPKASPSSPSGRDSPSTTKSPLQVGKLLPPFSPTDTRALSSSHREAVDEDDDAAGDLAGNGYTTKSATPTFSACLSRLDSLATLSSAHGIFSTGRPYSRIAASMLSSRVHSTKWSPLVHSLHDDHPAIANALGFIAATQKYRDMHRHDLQVTPRRLWLTAMKIYRRYLSHLFKQLNAVAPVISMNGPIQSGSHVRQVEPAVPLSSAVAHNGASNYALSSQRSSEQRDRGHGVEAGLNILDKSPHYSGTAINTTSTTGVKDQRFNGMGISAGEAGLAEANATEREIEGVTTEDKSQDFDISLGDYHAALDEVSLWGVSAMTLKAIHEAVFANVGKRMSSPGTAASSSAVASVKKVGQAPSSSLPRPTNETSAATLLTAASASASSSTSSSSSSSITPTNTSSGSFWSWGSSSSSSSSSSSASKMPPRRGSFSGPFGVPFSGPFSLWSDSGGGGPFSSSTAPDPSERHSDDATEYGSDANASPSSPQGSAIPAVYSFLDGESKPSISMFDELVGEIEESFRQRSLAMRRRRRRVASQTIVSGGRERCIAEVYEAGEVNSSKLLSPYGPPRSAQKYMYKKRAEHSLSQSSFAGAEQPRIDGDADGRGPSGGSLEDDSYIGELPDDDSSVYSADEECEVDSGESKPIDGEDGHGHGEPSLPYGGIDELAQGERESVDEGNHENTGLDLYRRGIDFVHYDAAAAAAADGTEHESSTVGYSIDEYALEPNMTVQQQQKQEEDGKKEGEEQQGKQQQIPMGRHKIKIIGSWRRQEEEGEGNDESTDVEPTIDPTTVRISSHKVIGALNHSEALERSGDSGDSDDSGDSYDAAIAISHMSLDDEHEGYEEGGGSDQFDECMGEWGAAVVSVSTTGTGYYGGAYSN